MNSDIYDPLTEYTQVFRERFKNIAETTFKELANEAQVDVTANQTTCKKIYKYEAQARAINRRRYSFISLCVILWIILLFCICGTLYICFVNHAWEYTHISTKATLIIPLIIIPVPLFAWIHPLIKKLTGEQKQIEQIIQTLHKEAWEQMEPLNRLYDWDVLTRMITQTVPKLKFDPYFTTQRLADLKKTYGWDDSFNKERSVIYSHSGVINGNPFVICRTKKMEMGVKDYHGHKTIHWTTTERGADGKYHTVTHSQTLTATVTKPYPYYKEKTRLIYGNTAAPDLTFLREKSGLADEMGSIAYKLKRKSLRKKARNLKEANYAMMSNEEFEVVFDTSNRNDNQQHALLFTPLAQQSMIKLLQDETEGYGDDFNFEKRRMINTIISDHMQKVNFDFNPKLYHNFDFNKAKAGFVQINCEYFRALYFNLAPLLCIPMYQQIRPHHDIYGIDTKSQSSFWEHEAQANLWGENKFKHPECVTDSILKTEIVKTEGGKAEISVHAHGYRAEKRLQIEVVYGGDGRYHDVPVYWNEYIPVTGCGTLYIKEDNQVKKEFASQTQRLEYINKFLADSNFTIYRRNIASKM